MGGRPLHRSGWEIAMTESPANIVELPRAAYLSHTMRRARTAAEQRSHRYVMLEHLLLALMDDPDGQRVLQLGGADIPGIRTEIWEAVNHRMATLAVPGPASPSFSYKFGAVMQAASVEATRLGRREVDGGLVLIALAREPESFAGKILRQNGFDPAAALRELAAGGQLSPRGPAPSQPLRQAPPPSRAAKLSPPPAPQAPSGDTSMEDMLASVRELLETEERKYAEVHSPVRAPAPAPEPPPRPAPAAPPPKPRLQPPGAADAPPAAAAAPRPKRAAQAATRSGLPVPAADAARLRARDQAVAGKLVENIPRVMRVAVPEIVEIRLSREESAALFQNMQGRGDVQAHDVTVTRAMTVRLRAPTGGFFIETLSPETQWVLDRPSFLGSEPFGRWVWTVIPNERGNHRLQVIIASRNIDENGLAGDLALPDQVIDVKVRINYRRSAAQLFRSVFLLLAGGALTEGALYLARTWLKF